MLINVLEEILSHGKVTAKARLEMLQMFYKDDDALHLLENPTKGGIHITAQKEYEIEEAVAVCFKYAHDLATFGEININITNPVSYPFTISWRALHEIIESLTNNRKIEAIKTHRQASGYGLKESKDFVEHIERITPTARTKSPPHPTSALPTTTFAAKWEMNFMRDCLIRTNPDDKLPEQTVCQLLKIYVKLQQQHPLGANSMSRLNGEESENIF